MAIESLLEFVIQSVVPLILPPQPQNPNDLGLPKGKINVFARPMPLFHKSNLRTIVQGLAHFGRGYAMFPVQFFDNFFEPDDAFNLQRSPHQNEGCPKQSILYSS
jgi:hypothetical protein